MEKYERSGLTIKKKQPKKKGYLCLLCGLAFADMETATTCIWIHMFRKDEHFKKMEL